MIPRHPADESRGYYFGTISPDGKVHWDEAIPYLDRITATFPSISCK
jgi:hypothetical protein